MASDAYAYGLSDTHRRRYIAEKQDEIVQRWLEASSPPILSSVAQANHKTRKVINESVNACLTFL